MVFTLPSQTTTPLEPLGFSVPSKEYLVKQFVGKKLKDCRTPRLVVDRSVVKRNCEHIAAVGAKSGKKIRVHIKTHKVCKIDMDALVNGKGCCKPDNFAVTS